MKLLSLVTLSILLVNCGQNSSGGTSEPAPEKESVDKQKNSPSQTTTKKEPEPATQLTKQTFAVDMTLDEIEEALQTFSNDLEAFRKDSLEVESPLLATKQFEKKIRAATPAFSSLRDLQKKIDKDANLKNLECESLNEEVFKLKSKTISFMRKNIKEAQSESNFYILDNSLIAMESMSDLSDSSQRIYQTRRTAAGPVWRMTFESKTHFSTMQSITDMLLQWTREIKEHM